MSRLQPSDSALESKKKAGRGLWERLRRFFQQDVWTHDSGHLPVWLRPFYPVCRFVLILIRGFQEDNCSLQASALTYVSLVSLVPILAIMFSFSRGVGMDRQILESIGVESYWVEQAEDGKTVKKREYRVMTSRPSAGAEEKAVPLAEGTAGIPQKVVFQEAPKADDNLRLIQKLAPPMQEAFLKILAYVENSNFAALGLIGSLMLISSVIFAMAKLERSFNTIWGVKTERNWLRKISEYLVVLILLPVAFYAVVQLARMVQHFPAVVRLWQTHPFWASVVWYGIRGCELACLVGAFCFFFMFMPNTKVRFLPGLFSGVTAAALWLLVQWAYTSLQVGLSNFNKVYGTFAIVPFFLAWLYANWSILLLGAELGYAVQNYRTIHLAKASDSASTGVCILLAQLVMYEACRLYRKGEKGFSVEIFSRDHTIPPRLLLYVVHQLHGKGLLYPLSSEEGEESRYVPGADPAVLTPSCVNEAFLGNSQLDAQMYLRDIPENLRARLVQNHRESSQRLSDISFEDLVRETGEDAG